MSSMHRLTVLVDNHAVVPELIAEHGLSIHIRLAGGQQWLWDTGQSGALVDNAAHLGCDLSGCAGLALSHGHYDHTGGIMALLEQTGFTGTIVGHPVLAQERFALRPGHAARSIGLPSGTTLPNFSSVEQSALLAPELTFVSTLDRAPGRFQATTHFFLDRDGQFADPVQDDACLLLDTADGPVVILGCCHSGLANTLHSLHHRLGYPSFAAVLGGLHLHGAPQWAQDETLQALEDFQVQWIAPGHCTGQEEAAALARRFSGQALPFGAGAVFDLPSGSFPA
jgi:7,8-dihydropterin-6-yl-methyl-4-(beta-D-ribofuranosyl)aminobenzene 5'-phosphate synthase